jgi:Tfp pilus assembly protein PilF
MSHPQRIPEMIQQALTALRNEEYTRAVAIADQLAAEVPDNPLVRAIRAQGLLYSNDPKAAFEEAQEAVELNPANAHAQAMLGYSAWRTERIAMAQSAFEAAVRFSDRDPFFLAEFAWFMANERAPKAAESTAQKAIEANAASSTAWAALGLAQFRMHRRSEAETSLRRALEINPNDIYAQSAMVALLQEQGQSDEAQTLAGMLKEHAGAEEMADSVRDEAKHRKLAAMLLERNIDLDAPPAAANRHLLWIAISAPGVCFGGILIYLDPHRPLPGILFAVMPPLLIWLYLRIWD